MEANIESQDLVQGDVTGLHVQATDNDQQLISNNLQEDNEKQSNNHQSVIQSTLAPPTISENTGMLESGGVNSLSRREALSRRPSYRQILKDLSAGDSNDGANKESARQLDLDGQNQDELNENEATQLYTTGENVIQANAQELQIQDPTTGNLQNIQSNQLQEFTMANLTLPQSSSILQQSDLNQSSLWPGGQVVVQTPTGMQAYQIQQNHPSTVMLAGRGIPTTIQNASPQQLAEDASRKRESRLMKNRDAAKECRRRKKEYVKCLETRVAVLEHQNKQLIDELKTLKELYVHKQVDTL